jgi:hypothetical protein
VAPQHRGTPEPPAYDVERRDDGWVVVTASGQVVSRHELEVTAMTERQRLLESSARGEHHPDAQWGAYPDNVGG